MSIISIEQCFTETQEEPVVCILCEGSHGNNTYCQATWSDHHEII